MSEVVVSNHKPELDGIRGIAVLIILIFHSVVSIPLFEPRWIVSKWFIPIHLGWAAVDIFFALSGFLITGILLRTKQSLQYFKSFYARRILRIFPLYYGTLIALFLIGPFFWPEMFSPPTFLRIGYLLYLQNVPPFHIYGGLGHYWSLAVEEQFYLVWPFVVWRCSDRWLLRICAVGIVFAIAFRIHLTAVYGTPWWNTALTLSRLDGLLIGAGCAVLMRKRIIPISWIQAAFGLSLSLIAFIALRYPQDARYVGRKSQVVGVFAFSLLSGALIVASHRDGPFKNLLRTRWLTVVGKYSYGMYVYHFPLFLIIARLTSKWLPLSLPKASLFLSGLIVLTFFLAKLSFDAIESRFLKLKKYFPADEVSFRNTAILALSRPGRSELNV